MVVDDARVGAPGRITALTLVLVAGVGCGAMPRSPSRPAPGPVTTATAVATAVTTPSPPIPEPLERKVWTTLPGSDACTAHPSEKVAEYQTYPSQPECEEWVKSRRCRPFSSCYDGCNTIGCDRSGMHRTTTLLECGITVAETIEFESKTLRPKKTPDWAALSIVASKLLNLPARQLVITASALPEEVRRSELARKQLAGRRAEWARQQMIAHGVDAERIRVEILEPGKMSVHDYRSARAWFSFDPSRRQPEEYDETSPRYDDLCWVKGARSR